MTAISMFAGGSLPIGVGVWSVFGWAVGLNKILADDTVHEPHQRLHESAALVAENLSWGQRDEKLFGLEEENRIYATDTTNALNSQSRQNTDTAAGNQLTSRTAEQLDSLVSVISASRRFSSPQ